MCGRLSGKSARKKGLGADRGQSLPNTSTHVSTARTPVSETPFNKALAALSTRLEAIDAPTREVWDPWTCPPPFLAVLAHAFSVDLWSLTGTSRPESIGLPTPQQLPSVVETPYGEVRPTHQNLNDGTNEGIACLDVRAFSVQYHPEAAPGPNDAAGLFDRFVEAIEANRA